MPDQKIIILSSEFPPVIGGAGTYAYDLATGMTNNHFEVEIISINYGKKSKALQQKLKKDNISLKYFKIKLLTFFFFSCKVYLTSLKDKNRFFIVSDSRAKKVMTLLQYLIPKRKTKHFVSVFHGGEIDTFFNNTKKSLKLLKFHNHFVKFLEKNKKIIVASQSEENFWKSKLPHLSKKIIQINHGINTNIFRPLSHKKKIKEKLNLDKETKYITSASRIIKNKGQDNVIKAFKNICTDYPNYNLIIIGDGDNLIPLKNKYYQLINERRLLFTGAILREEMAYYLNISEYFILTSLFEEAFGLVYIEAAACKIPSISGNRGGVTTAVINEFSGYNVPSDDNNELIKHMKLLNDEEIRNKLADNAYKNAIENFSHTVMATKIIKLFD